MVEYNKKKKECEKEKGATLLVSVLILALLTVFVAAALTNTTSNTVINFNDANSSRAFYAAYAGLEKMSKDFSDIFIVNTNPSLAQLENIEKNPPSYLVSPPSPEDPGKKITFRQKIRYLRNVDPDGIELESGPFAGLKVLRDEYELTSTATTQGGTQVQLTRSFYNNLIPIFQFGIFGTRDLEFYNGPPFNFGGRVHSNGDIYLNHSGDLAFESTVTTVGELIRNSLRNGRPRTSVKATRIKAPNGQYKELRHPTNGSLYLDSGSVVGKAGGPSLPTKSKSGSPEGTQKNPVFQQIVAPMGGRLVVNSPSLRLPFEKGRNKPIEIIRRTVDPEEQTKNPNLFYGRYFNKPGLRVTLADSQGSLPQGTGGINLEANDGTDNRLGYIPRPLGTYQASRVNGHRVRGWLKIETIDIDAVGNVSVTDITEDIARLGLTIPDPLNPTRDSMSVFRLQRYSLPSTTSPSVTTTVNYKVLPAGTTTINSVRRQLIVDNGNLYLRRGTQPTANNAITSFFEVDDVNPHANPIQNPCTRPTLELDTPGTVIGCNPIGANMSIPFPVNLYDPREGRVLDIDPGGTPTRIEPRGVFSFIDIDMQSLKRLLSGAYDPFYQSAGRPFRASQIPSPNNGWIIYLSDRRSDRAGGGPNGRYDMELIYGSPDFVPPKGTTLYDMQNTDDDDEMDVSVGVGGESSSADRTVDVLDALTKGAYPPDSSDGRVDLKIGTPISRALFRRAVRLVNGQDLSMVGTNSIATNLGLNDKRGITIATENPCYVQGNYNTGIPTNPGAPTPPGNYPGPQVPASVVADAITVLSNFWTDAVSFLSPYNKDNRVAMNTAYRFAVLTGRPRSGLFGPGFNGSTGANDLVMWGTRGTTGNVGPEEDDVRLYGGVHNFLRYIENWDGKRLSYVGALIDGWDSWQANGSFKCCAVVYRPPTRDYTFDTSFLDPKRLPPGTPNLQYLLLTSFRQNANPSVEKK